MPEIPSHQVNTSFTDSDWAAAQRYAQRLSHLPISDAGLVRFLVRVALGLQADPFKAAGTEKKQRK
jgi:hypothetical protein